MTDNKDREPLYLAAINCPHEIDHNRIVLHYDDAQPGNNALAQLDDRLAKAAHQVPPGFALVPIKVDNAMIDAANNVPSGIAGSPPHWQWVWDAMLAAAPTPLAPPSESPADSWAPARIWLQRGMGDEGSHTWCEDSQEECEQAEYVRVESPAVAALSDEQILEMALSAENASYPAGTEYTNASDVLLNSDEVLRFARALLSHAAQAGEQRAAIIEECCAAIKAEDDKMADEDYMLDSDDCIRVIRALATASKEGA